MEVVITGKFKDMLQQDVEFMVMQLGATIKAEVGQLTADVIDETFQAGPKVLAEAKALKKVILDLDNFFNIFDEYFNTEEASTPE
jgi:BRCT domain type II-containing protein